MPLNLQGFVDGPNQWAGLYHAADQLEKRKLRTDQLAAQQQAKRSAAGTFLQNYLDPKDYLSGTQFDPLVLQGLQEAMQQGARLAAAGADSPALMMALGPMVNRLSTYSNNAKNISKQVDDQIRGMKDTGLIGYDYSKLREEALRNAFYKQDDNGQLQLDPDQADPSVNWVAKAIELSPEKITTTQAFDTFADKAKMKSELVSIEDYDRFGTKDKQNVNLKYQEYMVPERKGNKVIGFVPKYEEVIEGGQHLMHPFTDNKGQTTMAPVRVLDESIFDGLPAPMVDYIRGQVKQHIKEYKTSSGEDISINSPKAKYIARAIAYDELNRPQRNFGSIGDTTINNKPSPQMISLNVQTTDRYLQNEKDKAEARAAGTTLGKGLEYKDTPVETIGEIFNGNPTYLQGAKVPKNGREMIDVTTTFKGGGLKSGRGEGFSYKGIFFDPTNRELFVEKEAKQDMFGRKLKSSELLQEKDIGPFIYRIAKSNGMTFKQTKALLEQMGYSNGRFKNAPSKEQRGFEKRQQEVQKWRETLISPFGLPFNQ